MLHDMHNHSSYSRDAKDEPEKIILNAIENGLEAVGISDHNYWFADRLDEYKNEIFSLKEKYKERIRVLCGIEVSFENIGDLLPEQIEGFDYSLLEYFYPRYSFPEVVAFRNRIPCRTGLAHTDIFRLEKESGDPVIKLMSENDIFWELNVNCDEIHGYREHEYVKRFTEDVEQQEIIKKSGIALSVGFDTHDLKDYKAHRVKSACCFAEENGFEFIVKSIVRDCAKYIHEK